ncbi:YheU family protein [Bowmanella sp. Y26]|uniref:YheU family protein n=1 Tax=Bowmanella yangjiangensis TaxID=2811230 RepID=UPI001BDBBC6B|nr:YheU family protein [Bowmanella yangjiangensis]MBT1065834.1 YheU family protein [Bowmanella yangjiangensis]
MIIPIDQLEAQTLHNIIEAFVLREGTDYGSEEISLAEKIQQVHQQLKSGDALLVYSELHESVNIVPAAQFSAD